MHGDRDPWFDESSEPLQALIKPELKPGERLLWASRPDHPSPTEARMAPPSGLAWGLGIGGFAAASFVVFVLIARVAHEGLVTFAIVSCLVAGLMSITTLLGTLAGSGRRRAERRRLAGRLYAITDSRAMIWNPLPGSTAVTVHTFSKGTIRGENLRRLQYPDGSGDVLFQNNSLAPAGFFGIADVRHVEDLIREFLVEPAPLLAPEPIYSEL